MVENSTVGAAYSYYTVYNIDDTALCASRTEFDTESRLQQLHQMLRVWTYPWSGLTSLFCNLLVRGVLVVQPADSAVDVQHPDTLLKSGSLNVRVQAWPLLKGKVEVDDIP